MAMHRTQRGHTLLESLIALLVLTAGAVSAVRMQSVILDSHCATKEHSNVIAATLRMTEQLRARSGAACCNPSGGCVLDAVPGVSASLISSTTTTCTYRLSVSTVSECKSGATVASRTQDITIPIPQKTSVSGGGNETGIEIPRPVIAELRNSDTGINNAANLPGSSTASETAMDRAIGVAIRITNDGRYMLYARSNSSSNFFERLISNNAFVRISGVLFNVSGVSSIQTLTTSSGLRFYATGTGFCQFPLYYTNADDPTTYSTTALPANTMSGAYVCYVPEGWYGNVGMDFSSIPNKTWACPDGTSSGTGNNPNLYGGFRSIKSIYSSPNPPVSENDIKGQSGVLTRHETEGRLRGLHFLLYSSNQKDSCPNIILNPNNKGQAQYVSFASHNNSNTKWLKSVGYGGLLQTRATASISPAVAGMRGSECRNLANNSGDPECLRPLDYWVELVGLASVTGALQRVDQGFRWDAVTLLANRPSPYGGTFSAPCTLETVASDQQYTLGSISFTCFAGSGDTITLGVPEGNGVELVESPPQQLTFTAPASNVTLKLKSK